MQEEIIAIAEEGWCITLDNQALHHERIIWATTDQASERAQDAMNQSLLQLYRYKCEISWEVNTRKKLVPTYFTKGLKYLLL